MTSHNKSKIYYLILLGTISFLQYPKLSLTQSRSIDPEIQKKIDAFIQNIYRPTGKISGLGLAIVQNDGEVLYTTGYGMADIAKGVPNQNSTQFLVSSITKSFTAVLTVKLLHENFPELGEGVLDTPIRRLLPNGNFTLIDRFRSEHATFRDLLAHRVCVSGADLQSLADPLNATTEEIAYRTRYNSEVCGFRGDFQYINELYTLTGELAGILANKSYEDAMQDLLDEIGLPNTAFVQRKDDFSQMPFRAMPYYVRDNETIPTNTSLLKRATLGNAAVGLFVNSNDMAKYMGFLQNFGSIDGKEIVPKEVMEWMRKPSSMTNGYIFKQSEEDVIISQFGYGLGLFLSSYDGWEYIHHLGYFLPYRSLMSLYPAQSLSIFTSTNNGPGHAPENVMVLHAFIFETMRGNENALKKAMKLQESFDMEKERENQKADNDFKMLYDKIVEEVSQGKAADCIVGSYGSGSLGELEVYEKFNEGRNRTEYFIDYGRWYRGWLEELVERSIFKINFVTDVVQDDYAEGREPGNSVVAFFNETLTISWVGVVMGTFQLGVRLDLLPPTPWSPGSCGSD